MIDHFALAFYVTPAIVVLLGAGAVVVHGVLLNRAERRARRQP